MFVLFYFIIVFSQFVFSFNQIKKYFHLIFSDPTLKWTDEYNPVIAGVRGFNKNRKQVVAACRVKVADELMSPFCLKHSPTGNLPNISFIVRKPEPLGIEFKTVCCARTGIMIWMEIQRSKAKMAKQEYYATLGAQTACLLRMVDGTQHCGQPITDQWEDKPMYTGEAGCYMHAVNDLYIGDSWFGSVKACEKLALRRKDCILCVKQANKVFQRTLSN